VEAVDFSMVVVELKHLWLRSSFTCAEEHKIIFVENDPAAKMKVCRNIRLSGKQLLEVCHLISIQLKPGDSCSSAAFNCF
jgi:hypothetical protein